MITNLNPYPAYKDSGAPWLGKVPVHWELRSLGSLISAISQRGQPDLPLLSVVREKGVIPRTSMSEDENHNFVPDDLSNYKVVRKGNLVINKMKAWQGSLGIAPMDGIVSPAYFVFDFRIGDQRFGQALLRSKTYVAFFAQESDGVRIGQWDLSIHGMKRIPVVVPPLPEQTAIVRFLDYMDRRIRRYIRAKQKLIKLLEEYRQALIHQAVTGQIDVRTGQPYPAYKDSGVEWLGQVPEHWEVVPLKRLAWFKSGAGFPVYHQGDTSAEIPFFKVSDMNIPGNEKYLRVCANTVSMTVAQGLGATVLPAGTIVFPKVGGALLTNKRRIAANQCCIDNNMMGCVARNVNRDFLFLVMSYIDLGQIAQPGPVPAISEREVREIRVALPSAPEQTAIVEYLDAQTAKIDAAISAARREIDLLREYRTRLISDVVTGKVDVREVAARLPEEPAEEEAELEDTEETAEGESADNEAAAETFSEEEVEP
ncbi:MAG: restriction endonuclease subunit S [Methanothrix sp.]|nr:restriction endonuclease subunit S [Methanothrix sp.]